MRNKIVQAAIVLITSILILYFYTLLHEGGHALAGLISNGRVDKMVLGLNARVYIEGARFTPFTESLFSLSGVLMPVLFLMISLAFYSHKIKNSIVQISYILFYTSVSGSLLAWLFVPLLSLFTSIPVNDDITKFLNISGLHPIILSSVTIVLFSFLLYVGYRKGLFSKIQEMIKKIHPGISPEGVNLNNRKYLYAVLLCLSLFLAYIFVARQDGVLKRSFSLEAISSAEDMKFPFEITKRSVYIMDLILKTKGILVDTQLYNESGQLIYHVIAEQLTLNKSLDLKTGNYFCLVSFMTDTAGMKEHIRKNGYVFNEECIQSMAKIFNDNFKTKHPVDFTLIIR